MEEKEQNKAGLSSFIFVLFLNFKILKDSEKF